jgi:ribosomal protein S18 acetylase RimI-like enzyme
VSQPFRLQPADAGRFVRVRRRMLADSPWAFAADPENDRASDPAQLAQDLAKDDEAIFAVEEGGELVATLGVGRREGAKFAHRALVWTVFVEPAHRGRGLGAALLARALELARTWPGIDYIDLAVSENSPHAKRLYERFGFVAWGREPEAVQTGGRRYDEHHMTLRLERAK